MPDAWIMTGTATSSTNAGSVDPSASLSREYSSIARAYATQWSPVIRPMALPLLDALPLAGASTVLDIGTGTGALLPDIRAKTKGRVLGIDRAEGMLQVTRESGWPLVAVSDAGSLCLRPQSVDVALFVFALFHMPDPAACLREAARALKPGGSIGIVCWGVDPGAPGASIWSEELNNAGAAPDPRDQSVMQVGRMNTPEKLKGLLDESGLETVRIWGEIRTHRWTLDRLLPFQLACGVASRRLPSLDAEARARCEARVRERLAGFSESELEYRPEVLYAVATDSAR